MSSPARQGQLARRVDRLLALESFENNEPNIRSIHGIHVWNISTRKKLLSLTGNDKNVLSVAFAPDGQLISSGSWQNTVKLWNTSTGALISTLYEHTDSVRCVVFTPDGQSVVSCSDDKKIRVWDVKAACSLSSGTSSNSVAALASATLRQDGWLVGPAGELLVWLPADYRKYLQLPPCTLRIDQSRVTIMIGDSGWHRGESWTLCWRKGQLDPVASNT